MLYFKSVCFLIVFLQKLLSATEEVPSFRIVAPQNICKNNISEKALNLPESITITFQPKDGLKLSYKFSIYFKSIELEPFSQRETLFVWKAVRGLEQRLNNKERLQIMKNNMFLIKKSEFVPGIKYIFHVVGRTDAGETSREQVFTIDYAEGALQNHNIPKGIDFLLIGSEEIVANIDYSVIAKVSFCEPKNDYYIEWKVSDLEVKYQMIENTISSTLLLPPNALSADRKTTIEASVKENGSKKVLANDVLWVEVLSKGFQASIIPSAARIGEGTFLTFRLFLQNYDNVEQLEIKWWLEDTATSQALQINDNDQNYFKVFFAKSGSFQVITQAKINDIATKVKADVEVINSIFVSYQFHDVPSLNPPANEEFQFSVMVFDMVADCEASWLSAQEEGFKLIHSGILDQEHYGYVKVPNSKIPDFSNSTIDHEITLNMPTNYGKGDVKWSGFEGDSMYKFRLDVTCPKTFKVNSQHANENYEPWNKVVTSYFTIDIHTNAPPQAEMILIDPLKGQALKTIFNINSEQARDLLLDTPVSYELIVKIDNFELSFGKYFQYKTWNTVLPYSTLPLQIKVKICDVRQACNMIKNDTVLTTTYEEFTILDYNAYVEKIKGLFRRTDFQDAFNYLIMITVTFKNVQSTHYKKWRNFIVDSLNKEIDKLLEQAEDKIFINADSKLQFVVRCKDILDYTQQMKKEILEKLLDILENIMDYKESRNDLEEQARFKRSQRMKRIINHSHELYTKTQLSLLEDLLKSDQYSPQAVDSFIQRMTSLAKNICLNENIHQEIVKSSLVTLTLRKVQGNFLQQHTTQLNTNVFEKVVLQFKNINIKNIKTEAQYCLIVKSYNFKENPQHDNSFIEYTIYEILSNTQLQELKINYSKQMTHKIQLDIYSTKRQDNKCLMKSSYDAAWSADPCISYVMDTFLRCCCSQTGFLKTAMLHLPPTMVNPTISSEISPTIVTSLPVFTSQTLISIKASQPITFTTTATTRQKKTQTNNDLQTNPTLATQNNNNLLQKASPFTYIIPLIFVLVFLLLGIFYLLYRRRLNVVVESSANMIPSMVLEFRKPASGIRYASIYNDHILSGNF